MSARGLWVLLAAAAGCGPAAASATPARPGALPVLGTAPAFALTDQRGRPVDRGALDGRPWVADFIFTRCGGPCPALTRQMQGLQPVVGDGHLVSFSVDPEHDTPAVLRDYARAYAADEDRWRFLTGSWAEVMRLAGPEGFKLTVTRTAPGLVVHTSMLVLVDAAGAIRGYYDGEDPGAMARLTRDLQRLRDEVAPAG